MHIIMVKLNSLSFVYRLSGLLTLGILALLVGCDSGNYPEPGLDVLAQEFKEANQAEDIAPMLALYQTQGSDARTLTLLKGALEYELGLPIKRIDFEPLSGAPEENIDFTHDGVAYGPSLKPRYRMRVIYAVDDQFTSLFSVGKSPTGEWRIVCATPKPEPSL